MNQWTTSHHKSITKHLCCKGNRQVFMKLRWNCRSHISGMFQSSFMYFVQRLNVPSLRFSSHFEARLWHNWYSCNLSYKSNRQVFMKFWWHCCSHILGMFQLASCISLKFLLQPSNKKYWRYIYWSTMNSKLTTSINLTVVRFNLTNPLGYRISQKLSILHWHQGWPVLSIWPPFEAPIRLALTQMVYVTMLQNVFCFNLTPNAPGRRVHTIRC